MSHDTNETKQHFEFRNLDEDMRKAYAEASRVVPAEHVRRLNAQNRGILITLVILLAAIAIIGSHMLGAF